MTTFMCIIFYAYHRRQLIHLRVASFCDPIQLLKGGHGLVADAGVEYFGFWPQTCCQQVEREHKQSFSFAFYFMPIMGDS